MNGHRYSAHFFPLSQISMQWIKSSVSQKFSLAAAAFPV
jgi:hypothetical protein